MSAHPKAPARDHGFVLNHPAIAATVITLGITGTFLGALYQQATSHHPSSHAEGAPKASGAPHEGAAAPAKSAGAAGSASAPH